MSLRTKVILLLALMIAAAGTVAWFYHGHQIEQGQANAAAAERERARSIVAKVKRSWDADDDWEDIFFPRQSSPLTPYTINVEQALIKGRPLIFFGTVDDVRTSGEQGASIVLIRCKGRTDKLRMGLLRLRLSLLSTPEVTDALLRNKPRFFESYVFAATVNSVEKIAMPPDKDDNDQDYFLRTEPSKRRSQLAPSSFRANEAS